jgi:hypothetical protein
MMRHLLLLLPLAACAPIDSSSVGREQAELTDELRTKVAGPPQSCVSTTATGQSLQVVDNRTLVMRSGGTVYVNRLEADCPGLHPLDIVIVEVHGSEYCRGDRMRSVPGGSSIPGPICPLGNFTPYRTPR